MERNYTFEFRLSGVTSGDVLVFGTCYTKDGFYSMFITDEQFLMIEKSLSEFNIGAIFNAQFEFNGAISDIAVYRIDPNTVFIS